MTLDSPESEHFNEGLVTAICFVAGAFCSALAGWIGMNVATKANVRTANAATESLGKALRLAFSSGACLGLLSFVRVLDYLLKRHREITVAFLCGFMAGSLRKIWPWKQISYSSIGGTLSSGKIEQANIFPASMNLEVILSIILIIIGFSIVMIMYKISNKKSMAFKK